jgi:hypothetical protein
MAYVIVLAVLLLVVYVVAEPLRRGPLAAADEAEEFVPSPAVLELEAARDAKYREIRDAELDHQTGKLSDADWDAIDSTLRAEAIEILRALDRAGGARTH